MVSIGVLFFRAVFRLSIEKAEVEILAPPLILGIIAVTICSALTRKLRAAASVLTGASVSMVCVVGGGILWASQARGFHTGAYIFVTSLALGIPVAIAGGLVGWLNRRRTNLPVKVSENS
jgi:nitrogen fixation-related uncharacterized protein